MVDLRPYRTFLEVEQPIKHLRLPRQGWRDGKFILRPVRGRRRDMEANGNGER